MPKIKLMTYNVYSGRVPGGGYDLDGKIELIRRFSPDILGLNEVHQNTNLSGNTSQTEYYAQKLGYAHRFFARAIYHDGGEYGIALLSRFPFISCRAVPVPDLPPEGREPHFESRVIIDALISTETGAKGGRLRVLTSHYGLSRSERINAAERTLLLAGAEENKENGGVPVIFMGDLNAEPDDDTIKPLFGRFTDCGGYCRDNDENILTFPSDAPVMRIDYIFVSKDIKPLGSHVPAGTASDHRPVIAEVEIAD